MAAAQGVKAECSDGVEEEQKQEGEQKESEGGSDDPRPAESAI
jgi:hypothetical protein